MKKAIIAAILAVLSTATASVSYGASIENASYKLDLMVDGKVIAQDVGRVSVADFRRMAKADEKDARTESAEKNGRVRIFVVDSPYLLDEKNDVYLCRFSIEWLDENGMSFKRLSVENQVSFGGDGPGGDDDLWKLVGDGYGRVSKWGFPITLLLFIIAIAL